MTILAEKLIHAKVHRVHGASRIELDLELGFGVQLRRTFTIDGIERVDPRVLSDAVHALVVLVGGKRVLVLPESDKESARNAQLFLNERIHGTPVGYLANVPGFSNPVLDIAVFMTWLGERGFDTKLVHEVVNGPRRREGSDVTSA